MGKTVSFFKHCKKHAIEVLKEIGISIKVVIVLGIILILILSNKKSMETVLTLATNIRIEEEKNIKAEDLLKIYPVLNKENYILDNRVAKKDEKIEEKEDIFDVSAVDAVSESIVINTPNYTKKSTKTYDRIDIYGVTIYDYSSKNIDYEELFERNINLTKKSDPVLLYCSHTSETYKNSDNFKFEYSGTYRVRDEKYNMLSVANIMAQTLRERGITTVFDTTPHDYTSYDNAYKNSMETINKNLEKYSRFGVVIDVHRDAAGDLSFGPKTTINGKSTAQLMLVVGVGYSGYENKYWEENLSLALQIVKKGEEMYPGLFRHVLVRDARYNQHLSKGSLLVEVGATGNTLEEAYYGARCFANILTKIYK